MALIPPPEERRKTGNGPSPYFSSVLGLFGGILAWSSASSILYKFALRPFLPPEAEGVTWSMEQVDEATRQLAHQSYGPYLMLAPQLVFVLVACVFGFLSRVSFVNRLALHPLRMGNVSLLLLCCGMLGVQGLVDILSQFLGEPGSQIRMLTEMVCEHRGANGILLGVLIAVVFGICAELFFRGLVQSRLVAIWPPGAAILLTAVVFAVVQYGATSVLNVLPIGLYLGWVAWRSGTVYASMLLHVLNNIAAVLLGRVELPVGAIWAATVVLLGLGFLGARRLAAGDLAAETARRSREDLT